MRLAGSLAALVLAALVLAACGGGASTEPAGTEPAGTSASAPCAEDAITAAVKDGATDPIEGVDQYECSGDWAYAGVTTPGPDGFEYTALLQWSDGAWKTVDREQPCEDGSVPSDIRTAACDSN